MSKDYVDTQPDQGYYKALYNILDQKYREYSSRL